MNGPSICPLCTLFEWNDDGTPVCAAFPDGIPAEILHQGFDHRNEYPGDRGVRFTSRPGVKPERLEAILGS